MGDRLSDIDSLVAGEQYDSAYKMVMAIEEHEIADEEQQAHYWLLRFQTSYLTNNTLPPDSILNRVTQHYQSSGNAIKLADCYYYKAILCFGKKDIDQSVLLFKQAEEQSLSTGNVRLLFKIAEALSNVNSFSGNYSLSLDYGRKALTDAMKSNRKDWLAYAYYRIGVAFYNLNRQDSALAYFDKTSPYIKYIRKEDRPYFLSNLSLVYINSQPEKELMQGSVECQVTLMDMMDRLYADMEKRVGIDRVAGSLVHYKQARTTLGKFIEAKFKTKDIAFGQLTNQFISDYYEFLLTNCGFRSNSTRKLSRCLTILA